MSYGFTVKIQNGTAELVSSGASQDLDIVVSVSGHADDGHYSTSVQVTQNTEAK